MKCISISVFVLVCGLLAPCSTASGAWPVAIENAGFEDSVLGDGVEDSSIPGWTEGKYNLAAPTVWVDGASGVGVWNPDTSGYTSGLAEAGENMGFTCAFAGIDNGMNQILAGATGLLEADAQYDMSVKLGNPFLYNEGPAPDYRIELVAGGVVVASETGASPADDTTWGTAGFSFNPGAAHAQLGDPLEIRLLAVDDVRNDWYEVDYDSVSLTAIYAHPVPYAGDGPYHVVIGTGSLSLNATGSLPSDSAAITAYDWDFNSDGSYELSGVTPAAIGYAELTTTYGLSDGANTVNLRVTDDTTDETVRSWKINIAPSTTTYTGTGARYDRDTWNVAGNWDNGVPTGAIDVELATGYHVSVRSNSAGATPTPVYTGNLTLNANSMLEIGNACAAVDINALGTGSITMHTGSYLRLRYPWTSTHSNDIIMAGDATIAVGASTSAHGRNRTFSGVISGTGLLILHTTHRQIAYFTNTNTWSGGLLAGGSESENKTETIVAAATGAFGTGDVTINDGVTLQIDALNPMDSSATLYLAGRKSGNNVASKLIMNADNTVLGFYLDGIEQAMGAWGSSASRALYQDDFIFSGNGILIVDPGKDTMDWLGGAGNWSVGANWDPGLIPDADVTIDVDGSDVTVDADQSAWRVSVGASAASNLVIPAGKTLVVTGPVANGALTIGQFGSMTVDGALNSLALNSSGSVTINPTADVSGVDVVNVNDGTVTAPTLTLDKANINGGALTVSGALTLGEANLNSGTLAVGGVLTADVLNVAGGSTTLVSPVIPQINATGGVLNVEGAGITNLKVDGGEVNTTAAATVTKLRVDSGKVNLTGGDLSAATATLAGGAIDARTNALVVSGTAKIGLLTIEADGADFKLSGADMVNAHTLTLTGGVTTAGVVKSAAGISYFQISDDNSEIGGSQIDSNKTYTHAIDFGNSGAATVNGVAFANDIDSSPGALTNAGTRTYGPNNHGGNNPPAVNGDVASVFRDMRYNGPDGGYVELTGLTEGQWYDVRLYDRAWDYNSAIRTFYAAYDVGGDDAVEFTTPKIDQNRGNLDPPNMSGNVSWAMSYVYQADSSGKIKVIIDLADDKTGTYHLYGLTNEETFVAPGFDMSTTTVAATEDSTLLLTSEAGDAVTLGGIEITDPVTLTLDSPAADFALTNMTLRAGSMVKSTLTAETSGTGNVAITVDERFSSGGGESYLGNPGGEFGDGADWYMTNLTLSGGVDSVFDWTFSSTTVTDVFGEDLLFGDCVNVYGAVTMGDGLTIQLVDGLAPGVSADSVDVVLFRAVDDAVFNPANITIRSPVGAAEEWTWDSLAYVNEEYVVLKGLMANAVAPPSHPGDANGDGNVDEDDLDLFWQQFGQRGPDQSCDFDGDGDVDINDLAILQDNFGYPLVIQPGDANGDGVVDSADAEFLDDQWGRRGADLSCDWNGDGIVGPEDLLILRAVLGGALPPTAPEPPAATTPEPATAILLLFGLGTVIRRRRGVRPEPAYTKPDRRSSLFPSS